MPRHSGRPPARTFTIEDCASVTLYDNPTPRCPHGLRWREADADLIASLEVRALMCTECESTEYHPHDGESITLLQPRSIGGREPLRSLYLSALSSEIGQPQPATFVDDLVRVTCESVSAWTWTGRDGECLPLPKDDWPTVAKHLEYAEVLWIIEATLGGADPRQDFYRPPALPSGKDSANG
jgi:hypothetical protein